MTEGKSGSWRRLGSLKTLALSKKTSTHHTILHNIIQKPQKTHTRGEMWKF